MSARLVENASSDQAVSCDCLPGYRLRECLGRTPLAEVWQAENTEGRERAVKYVYAAARHGVLGTMHLDSATRLTEMTHTGLAAIEAVANDQGRLVFVTDLGTHTLRDLFNDALERGRSGMERAQLLDALEVVAEALDYLRREHDIHHLSLNPRSIIFVDGEARLADFGIVELLWIPAGADVARLNPRYAPPELFEGRYNVASDQYSLALIYAEMLTGSLPHRGQTARQLAEQRRRGALELDDLPATDRPIVAKALRFEPRDRFWSCLDFISALRADKKRRAPKESHVRNAPAAPAAAPSARAELPSVAPSDSLEELIRRLVTSVATYQRSQEAGGHSYELGDDAVLHHRCAAWLPDGVVQHKLLGLVQRWHAEVVRNGSHEIELGVDLTKGFWHRILRGRKRLEIVLTLHPTKAEDARLTEVQVTMRIGRRKQDKTLLSQIGPVLIDDLHNYLLATPERRIDDRFPYARQFSIAPKYTNAKSGAPVTCEGVDISVSGIGFVTDSLLETEQIYVYQSLSNDSAPFAIPAAVTRVQRLDDGRYLAAAKFITGADKAK